MKFSSVTIQVKAIKQYVLVAVLISCFFFVVVVVVVPKCFSLQF